MRFTRVCQVLLLWGVCLVHGAAQAQRDPTVAPPEMGTASGERAGSGTLGAAGVAVVVRDGKPFLVSGTRLYAPGQNVGPARLERITETEVWLREGKELRKISRFEGVQRSVAASAPVCGPGVAPPSHPRRKGKKRGSGKPATTADPLSSGASVRAASSTAPPAVPCDGAQP